MRCRAPEISRSNFISIVLRLRKIHSSWCCWLRSPSSEGTSRRDTTCAAFCADMLRRSSSAFFSSVLRYVANLGLGPDFMCISLYLWAGGETAAGVWPQGASYDLTQTPH